MSCARAGAGPRLTRAGPSKDFSQDTDPDDLGFAVQSDDGAPNHLPCDETISAFYTRALSCGEDLGPKWSGSLTRKHLEDMAQQLSSSAWQGFGSIGKEELARIFEAMDQNGDGRVTYREFVAALKSGPVSTILRQLVWNLRSSYDHGFVVPADFDYSQTTVANYRAEGLAFVGEFVDFRQTRDHSYHGNFTAKRQLWQDHVIRPIMQRTTPQQNPWLVYTCGPMGVGKGYTLRWMSKNGFFPLENIVHIDPDGFKMMMPEWPHYVKLDRESAGSQCHKESAFMMEVAQEAAMSLDQNIWVDGSLRDADHYHWAFTDIRTRFPHYRIAIFYVFASEDVIRARVQDRAEKTGRHVPEHLLKHSLAAMDYSLNKLTPLCDFVARIENEGAVPVLRAFEHVNTSGSWCLIKDTFARTQPDVGEFPKSLSPFNLRRLPAEYKVRLHTDGDCLDVELLLAEGGDSPTLDKMRRLLPSLGKLTRSPMHALTLPGFVLWSAGAPACCRSFCWIYSLYDGTPDHILHRKHLRDSGFFSDDLLDPLVQLVRAGGFAYCGEGGDVLAVNVISRKREPLCIQFGEPRPVPQRAVAAIPEGRFHGVPAKLLRKRGARTYAWATPGETFAGVEVGNDHGAFVFQVQGCPDGHLLERTLAFPIISD